MNVSRDEKLDRGHVVEETEIDRTKDLVLDRRIAPDQGVLIVAKIVGRALRTIRKMKENFPNHHQKQPKIRSMQVLSDVETVPEVVTGTFKSQQHQLSFEQNLRQKIKSRPKAGQCAPQPSHQVDRPVPQVIHRAVPAVQAIQKVVRQVTKVMLK